MSALWKTASRAQAITFARMLTTLSQMLVSHWLASALGRTAEREKLDSLRALVPRCSHTAFVFILLRRPQQTTLRSVGPITLATMIPTRGSKFAVTPFYLGHNPPFPAL
jgi:hypothetical protein